MNRTLHKISSAIFAVALAVALAAALSGCYTQVRTVPPPPPPPPPYEAWAREPEPAPEGIDGEYSGTIIVADETGHHVARVRFVFDDGWYRCEVESLPLLEGEFELRDGEIILVERGVRDGEYPWRLAPSGHFELRRSESGLGLVQRLPGRGSYREVLLTRDETNR